MCCDSLDLLKCKPLQALIVPATVCDVQNCFHIHKTLTLRGRKRMSESMAMSSAISVSEAISDALISGVVAEAESNSAKPGTVCPSSDSKASGRDNSGKKQDSDKMKASPSASTSHREFASIDYLCLAATVSFLPGQVVFSQQGLEFSYDCDEHLAAVLQRLFLLLDGTRALAEVRAKFSQDTWEAIATILHQLDAQDLLDNAKPFDASLSQPPSHQTVLCIAAGRFKSECL